MRIRTAIVAAAVLLSSFGGVVAAAEASPARLGGKCSVAEMGKVRYVQGKKLRCTSTGATGTKWVRSL